MANLCSDDVLFILPLSFFEKIASYSDQYAYMDSAVEKHETDRDRNKKKVRHFEEAPPVAAGARWGKRHRHRANKAKERLTITTGYVLCWFAALILQETLFSDSEPRANDLYATKGHGINVPILCNAMKRDAYKFLKKKQEKMDAISFTKLPMFLMRSAREYAQLGLTGNM